MTEIIIQSKVEAKPMFTKGMDRMMRIKIVTVLLGQEDKKQQSGEQKRMKMEGYGSVPAIGTKLHKYAFISSVRSSSNY